MSSRSKAGAIPLHRSPVGTSRPCRVARVLDVGGVRAATCAVEGEPLRYTAHFGPDEVAPEPGDRGWLTVAGDGSWSFSATAPAGQGVGDGR
jgi:hypothetical protein